MMDNCNCSYRCDCTALSVMASIILGIITGFLAFSGTITLTPAFFSLLITWAARLVKLRPDVTIKQKGAQKYSVHLRLSKKSRKVWAFSSFYGIISLGDEI